jgi:Gram-negative porin
MNRKAATAVVLAALTWQAPAWCEVKLGEGAGWTVSTDGRVNAFISVARGTAIPDSQSLVTPGAVDDDAKDSNQKIRSTRIRNGFLASILGFNLNKQVLKDLKVTARAALWMNTSGGRTKNTPGGVDPRELYGKMEGSWGSFLGGSNLALFGRGGILVDAAIAHDYGMGYPCSVQDAGGGACGMAAFGAIFPAFEPGFVYTTPSLGGFELALGMYDPATVQNSKLARAPLPRLEAEAAFSVKDVVKVFASGYWQKLEGSEVAGDMGKRTDLNATAWGGQGGLMLNFGPVMAGGAGFMGQGIAPITYIEENEVSFDKQGIPRKSRGGFGLAAVNFDAIHLKVAGGAGVFHLDKSPNDPDPVAVGGGNPSMLKQNFGITAGVYQTTGPLHFALEYFRAEHDLYEYGEANPNDPTLINIKKPVQVVNYINAGFTIVW